MIAVILSVRLTFSGNARLAAGRVALLNECIWKLNEPLIVAFASTIDDPGYPVVLGVHPSTDIVAKWYK